MYTNIWQIIESIDWLNYQDNVLSALDTAINKYSSLDIPAEEKIYQISIWTDPTAQVTAVNFETKEHANRHILVQQQMLETLEVQEPIDTSTMFTFQGNPADFKYSLFHYHHHEELKNLSLIDFNDYENEQAVLVKLEENLMQVLDRIKISDTLMKPQMEDEVWVGVNSTEDWYDHVQKISVR